MSVNKGLPKMSGEIGVGGVGQGAGPQRGGEADQSLAQGQHDRGYNPVDSAPRVVASSVINSDAARYKKGPGPL